MGEELSNLSTIPCHSLLLGINLNIIFPRMFQVHLGACGETKGLQKLSTQKPDSVGTCFAEKVDFF